MKILSWLLGIIAFLIATQPVAAGYALPYPSYMPGHRLYPISRMLDRLKSHWYWGSIAQLKYHLALADKYLVEAKTLFEYGQYLLAVDALERSTHNVEFLPSLLQKAKNEGKDPSNLELVVYEAMSTHIKLLTTLRGELPEEFLWQPERSSPTHLALAKLLSEAITKRNTVLNFHVQ